jgi:hypothetical protein
MLLWAERLHRPGERNHTGAVLTTQAHSALAHVFMQNFRRQATLFVFSYHEYEVTMLE